MVYTHLEQECRKAARSIRSGEAPSASEPAPEWAPFRPLRQLLAPELRRGRDTANPFGRMILACRSLNLRLWFFNRAIVPAAPADLPAEARQKLAGLLDRCADRLHSLVKGALLKKQVEWADAGATTTDPPLTAPISPPASRDALLAHGIHATVLRRLVRDLRTATASHNALLASLGKGPAAELAPARPIRTGARLLDENSVRSGVKLVVILLLLLVEVKGCSRISGRHAGGFLRHVLRQHGQPRPAEQDRPGRPRRPPGWLPVRGGGGLPHRPLAILPPPFGAGVPGRIPGQPGLSKAAPLWRRRPPGGSGDSLRLSGDTRAGVGILHHGADPLLGSGRGRRHGRGRPRLPLAGAAHAPPARLDRRRPAGRGGEPGPAVRLGAPPGKARRPAWARR